MFLKIVGVVSILFGLLGIVACFNKTMPWNTRSKTVMAAAFFILIGWFVYPSQDGNVVSSGDGVVSPGKSTAPEVKTETPKQEASKSTPSQFSPENPVTVEYLKESLVYIDVIYKNLKETMQRNATINREYLNPRLEEARKRIDQIGYATKLSVEPADIFEKRGEVATTWTLFGDLIGKYSSYSTKGYATLNDVTRAEADYLTQYKSASDLLK